MPPPVPYWISITILAAAPGFYSVSGERKLNLGKCNSHAENVNTHTDAHTCTRIHIVYNFFHLFLFRQIRVWTSQLITLILIARELTAFATTYRWLCSPCQFCSVFKPKRQITHLYQIMHDSLGSGLWTSMKSICTHTHTQDKKAVVFYYQHYF